MICEEFNAELAAAKPDRPAPQMIKKFSPHMNMTAWFKPVYADEHGRMWRDDGEHITLIYDPIWKAGPRDA